MNKSTNRSEPRTRVRHRSGTLSAVFLLCGFAMFASCSGAEGESRISGTYVSHGPNFAEMLQLTQTDNGQISGVLSSVELKAGGGISSEQTPMTGAVDADQLTLSVRSGLVSFLGAGSIAGTVRGNTIQLQTVDSKGNVSTSAFVRSTSAEFKAYAAQLRSKGVGIELSTKLLNGAQELSETVRNAEKWIANAELHTQRIPGVREYYGKLEEQMRLLVARERRTPDSVARSQISVMVIQGNVAGIQSDLQVDQMWDLTIGDSGRNLSKIFANLPSNCGTPDDLQKRGATPQAVEAWESACQQTLAERLKFEPIYKRVMKQRADLKSFQATAQSNRQALVDEASRIQ